MGGVDSVPAVDVALEAREAEGVLAVRDGSVLVSDIVDGRLPRPYATVSVTNVGVEWIQIADLACVDVSRIMVQVQSLMDSEYCRGAAWPQGRRIVFRPARPWANEATPFPDKPCGSGCEDIVAGDPLQNHHPTNRDSKGFVCSSLPAYLSPQSTKGYSSTSQWHCFLFHFAAFVQERSLPKRILKCPRSPLPSWRRG